MRLPCCDSIIEGVFAEQMKRVSRYCRLGRSVEVRFTLFARPPCISGGSSTDLSLDAENGADFCGLMCRLNQAGGDGERPEI